jgi:hypothetical protein
MFAIGHSVRELERSRGSAAFEETPGYLTVGVFGCLTILVLGLCWQRPAVLWAAVPFASLTLYASVRSTFVADRLANTLTVRRRILFWDKVRAYDSAAIDRITVRHTQKGSGLLMMFKSGRKKMLTMSIGADILVLNSAAVALNSVLRSRKHK